MAFFSEIDPYGPTVSVTYLPTKEGDQLMVECVARMWDVETRYIMSADDCHDMLASAHVGDDGSRSVRITDADSNVLAQEIRVAERYYLGQRN